VPISRKRKKNGKKVQRKPVQPSDDLSAGVSLQDLINVVAYQQYVEDGTIEGPQIPDQSTRIADDVKITMPEVVPVTIGEGVEKRQIGTASPIEGDPEHVSIHITDPEVTEQIRDKGSYSIDKDVI
jgi:hypothetical protein